MYAQTFLTLLTPLLLLPQPLRAWYVLEGLAKLLSRYECAVLGAERPRLVLTQ